MEVCTAENRAGALRQAAQGIDTAIVDIALGEESGVALLEALREKHPLLPTIMISGVASVEEALETLRMGACDFIEKPIRAERLVVAVNNALALSRLRSQALEAALPVAESPAMQDVVRRASRAAAAKTTVLLAGESGTGKDRVARLLHALSPRADGPFVKINCGALPESLAESELFGHVKGAFTGAINNAPGRIAAADGGTLFLDEVGELSPGIQVKLLRFLETGELQRVGDHKSTLVDARLIAATNRDLQSAVEAGVFRSDLFYRLNVVPITVPPLRERTEEIRPLVRYFAAEVAAQLGTPIPELDAEAYAAFEGAEFPGNVRELRNAVERLLVLAEGPRISAAEVRDALGVAPEAAASGQSALPAEGAAQGDAGASGEGAAEELFETPMPLSEARRQLERAYLVRQLKANGGSVKRTAWALSVLPHNLSRRLARLGISTRVSRSD
jgi:DNA-binding NtrC family response regulator